MEKTVQKTTSKGQITLPKAWRGQFKTTHFVVEPKNETIIIKPLFLEDSDNYTVLFNADKNNKGKGISAKRLLKALR